MNSRILWSIIILILGVVLILVGTFVSGEAMFLLYYGIAMCVVAIIIFFNKKEDKIEQIKSVKFREVK